tara:strand:+ start:557 stop:733 length:177 start_codon:yes stop_codon:yes gene_type:complete
MNNTNNYTHVKDDRQYVIIIAVAIIIGICYFSNRNEQKNKQHTKANRVQRRLEMQYVS